VYAFVASILAALVSSLIWNWNNPVTIFMGGFYGRRFFKKQQAAQCGYIQRKGR
jgi:hypothetical protein